MTLSQIACPKVPVQSSNRIYGFIVLIIIADLFLLPMFQIGGIPWKVSFILIGLVFIDSLNNNIRSNSSKHQNDDFALFGKCIGIIIVIGLIGEIILTINHNVISHKEAVRSILSYTLIILGFRVGQCSTPLRIYTLVWIFTVTVTLTLIFSIYGSQLPSWLVEIYFQERHVIAFDRYRDIEEMLDLNRSPGLFGNPNTSALMINIIVLFIHVANRNRLISIKSNFIVIMLIVTPIFISIVLGSRNQCTFSLIVGVLNMKYLRLKSIDLVSVFASTCVVVIAIIFLQTKTDFRILNQFERVTNFERLLSVDTHDMSESVLRPLLLLDVSYKRFVVSPLWGSGYGSSYDQPYEFETKHYHNDWFRMLVTSGIIGTLCLIYAIKRLALPLGWPVVMPFILPGMTNTFILNPQAFIFYWLMVGLIREKCRLRVYTK